MNWLALGVISAACLWLYALGYGNGHDRAAQDYQAQIKKQEADHAIAALEAQTQYQRQLNQALEKAQVTTRSYLAIQARLQQQNQQLKESLNEATAHAACSIDAGWLQHYRQALGVPAAHSNGAGHSRSAANHTVTTTELLRHAIDYGQWCQSNTEQLIALQRVVRQRSESSHE